MPRRADIDPAEIVSFLPRIILVDVVPDDRRFVYRLVGTSEVEMRGYDPTGKPVRDFCGPGDQALQNYDTVVGSKEPHVDMEHVVNARRDWVDMETIFLPLSEYDEEVNMILVYSTQERVVLL